jgi:hypothetical protein
MYTIAAKQLRSSTVGVRPPYQGRGGGGSSGARIAHNSSGTRVSTRAGQGHPRGGGDPVPRRITNVARAHGPQGYQYGRYPFASVGVFTIQPETGMETQTMVTLGRNMPEEDLVHELAHQWFGSSARRLR